MLLNNSRKALLLLIAFCLLTGMAPLTATSTLAPVPGTYNAGDVAAINAIIANNGLKWTPADPADGSYVPADWRGISWSMDDTDRRVNWLSIQDRNLTGTLDAKGLTDLGSLKCQNNQLDAISALPPNICEIDCSSNLLTALPTLPQKLSELRCYDNQLTALPDLPSGIRDLWCDNNRLASLPALPSTLLWLFCGNNQLTALPSNLPNLRTLNCDYNQLTALPELPYNLERLICSNNRLTALPALPPNLMQFWCFDNQLTALPDLPSSIQELFCNNNLLAALPPLPINMRWLRCDDNQLTELPRLPPGLSALYCNNNQLTALPALPNALTHLDCSNNRLFAQPSLPYSMEYYSFWPQQHALNPFADIKESDWFYGSVMYAYRGGLFGGVSATEFDPGAPMTRAMFATVLARLDGADSESGPWKSEFADVAGGDWYYDAVMWAADNSIVSGVGDGRFGPNEPVTREQMAVMLVNYFRYIGADLKTTEAENVFADDGRISDWAKGAVKSVRQAGIIGGKPGNLFDPQGNATRAEVAAIFSRI